MTFRSARLVFPSRRLPNSIPAVLRTLTAARDTYQNVTAPADRAASDAQ